MNIGARSPGLDSDRAVLVVTADDFGLTDGVCRAILRTAAEGVVTATSVLAVAPAASRWAGALADSGLGVGCHLAVVGEDPPLCTAAEIPTLVDRRGRLASSWRTLSVAVLTGRVDPADLRREFRAQMAAMSGWGLDVDHLDTHQHVHLLPPIGRVVADLARTEGELAVRIPTTRRRSPQHVALRRTADRLRGIIDATPGVHGYPSWGLEGAGGLDTADLVGRVDALVGAPPGVYEISAHPGGPDDVQSARYSWGYAWEQEADALCSEELSVAVQRSGLQLGTVTDRLR